KSITQRNLTEIEPSRKVRPLGSQHSNSSERTVSRERDRPAARQLRRYQNQLWEGMRWRRSQFIRQWTTASGPARRTSREERLRASVRATPSRWPLRPSAPTITSADAPNAAIP